MRTFSLTPLLRSTVGFDRLNDLFDSLKDNDDTSGGYPPYNIEKLGEDRYAITMAVAGFNEQDLNITVESDRVTVLGRRDDNSANVEYLYHGIAARAFERTFRLADHMKVTGADLQNGLLRIALVREIPEEQKPRTIEIKRGAPSQVTVEHVENDAAKESMKLN